MNKHNAFMKKTIQQIINDAQEQEVTYEKRKKQYKPVTDRKPIKLRSEPKFKHKVLFDTLAKEAVNP